MMKVRAPAFKRLYPSLKR